MTTNENDLVTFVDNGTCFEAIELDATERRVIRDLAGVPSHYPVVVDPSEDLPKVAGVGYRHETPSGELVRHPNAYRQAFGKPVYVASTRRVVVGVEFARAVRSLVRIAPLAEPFDFLSAGSQS